MGHNPGIAVGFSTPSVGPLYESPPVEYRESRLVNILFRTTPEVIETVLPEPLVPNPDNLMLLAVNCLQSDLFGPYNELTLAVPSMFEGRVGQYCVILYVDKDSAIAAGLEIWGFPKKHAQISVQESPQRTHVVVERQGVELIQVTLEQTEPVATALLSQYRYGRWLNLTTWFNYKLIPSVKKGTPPAVQQLTSTTMQNLTLQQVRMGKAQIVFGTSSADPLQEVTVREVVAGFSTLATGTLPFGEIICDYSLMDRRQSGSASWSAP
jgi:acetoacetate decarboxylase